MRIIYTDIYTQRKREMRVCRCMRMVSRFIHMHTLDYFNTCMYYIVFINIYSYIDRCSLSLCSSLSVLMYVYIMYA